MSILDRARIELAVLRYDFWLDFRGVSRRRRRDLREELRGNLMEAAAHDGVSRALVGIGSPASLAQAVADSSPARPRWAVGAYAALAFFAVLTVAWLFSMLGFAEGVQASGVTGRTVTGELFPWGSEVTAEMGGGGEGMSFSGTVPAFIWIGSLVVLLLGAQPWRLLTQRRRPAGSPA